MSVRISEEKIEAYRKAFVLQGWGLTKIAKTFGVSVQTLGTYSRRGAWVAQKKQYGLEASEEHAKLSIQEKSELRGQVYFQFQQRILDRLKNLDSQEDPDYEEKISKLMAAYDKAVKGERLEDNQPTTTEKHIVDHTRDENVKVFKPMFDSYNFRLTEHDPSLLPKQSSNVSGTISIPDRGETIGQDTGSSSDNSQEDRSGLPEMDQRGSDQGTDAGMADSSSD